MKEKRKTRVVVLDSGIDRQYSLGRVIFAEGAGFHNENGKLICDNDIYDNVGHGTGVSSMIHRVSSEISLIPIKIIDYNICTTDILIAALEYVHEKVDCDIINISLGVTCCDRISELYQVCQKLQQKGVIIVSAFDNQGLISYPAAFDCVIGIDANRFWRKPSDYTAVKNSEINFVGYCIEQRVAWINGGTQIVSGNSFTAPYFTGLIARMLQKECLTYQDVMKKLFEFSKRTVEIEEITSSKPDFFIQKSIAFPFNKEMHSLARFRNMLQMNDIQFYDIRYMAQIGKRIRDYSWSNEENEDVILDYSSIDWNEDFDTFILGHVSEIERITQKQFVEDIVNNCVKYNKKLFAFFDIEDRIPENIKDNLVYYFPKIDNINHKERKLSYKTYNIGVPVLAVVGTSSRQGKFTVQLALRKAFQDAGYEVGQLGTEPSSLLFGLDAVYPMGYESTVMVKGNDAAYVVNRMIGDIQNKEPDIIIVGSQSGIHATLPCGYASYTTSQYEFLLGCQADAYILCVNVDDSYENIHQIIKYLESIYNAKVLAIVLSPILTTTKWSIINNVKNRIDPPTLINFQKKLSELLNLPVFILNGPENAKHLMNVCVDFFS